MQSNTTKENHLDLKAKMKEMLSLCTKVQQERFYLMYRSIDKIPDRDMDWAFCQIEKTIKLNRGDKNV